MPYYDLLRIRNKTLLMECFPPNDETFKERYGLKAQKEMSEFAQSNIGTIKTHGDINYKLLDFSFGMGAFDYYSSIYYIVEELN